MPQTPEDGEKRPEDLHLTVVYDSYTGRKQNSQETVALGKIKGSPERARGLPADAERFTGAPAVLRQCPGTTVSLASAPTESPRGTGDD